MRAAIWGTHNQRRNQSAVAVLVALLGVVLASTAAARPLVEPGTYPLSQLAMFAQQYAPGAAVPTKFPPGVVQFRLGPGRMNGYAARATSEVLFEKSSASLLGFKLDVFPGSKVPAITTSVAAYMRRGGWKVATSAFTAGPYRGVFERQSNGGNRFEMYTWASAGKTYVLTTYVLYAGKAQNPWAKARVIASFKQGSLNPS
jgi:hypothetical protein